MLMLFGTIATVGIQSLVKNKVDFSQTRNIIIASLMLTTGVGGAELTAGSFSLSGIGLAAIVGIILNLFLPKKEE
jgi:uracil permease